MDETPKPPTAPVAQEAITEQKEQSKPEKYEKNDLMLMRVRALRRWVEDIYTKKHGKPLHISPEFIEQFQLLMIYQLDQCIERAVLDERSTLMQNDAVFIHIAKVRPLNLPKHLKQALGL